LNNQSALLIELKTVFDQAVKAYKKGALKPTNKKQEYRVDWES
jgi:hypothetical protein